MMLTTTTLRTLALSAVLSAGLLTAGPGCGGSTPDASEAVVTPEQGPSPATPPPPAPAPTPAEPAATPKPEG